jgi:ubiquinone/menaquinone biosynthesis C-methylase UbiE
VSVENGGLSLLNRLRDAGYDAFKMISQRDVPRQRIPSPAREGDWIEHAFPFGASGLFAEESPGEWVDFAALSEADRLRAHSGEAHGQGQGFDLHARHSTRSAVLSAALGAAEEVLDILDFLSPDNFGATVSRKSHMRRLLERYDDKSLFVRIGGHSLCDLKRYSDLLVYAFIRRNVPQGSKLLEIGGGYSRVLSALAEDYECWNLDKCEGLGNGPTTVPSSLGFHLVQEYIGNFSPELPERAFDCVFSISVLEHVPEGDAGFFKNIIADMARVARPGAYSLHCVDSVAKSGKLWRNSIVPYMEGHIDLSVPVEDWARVDSEGDLHEVSRESYDRAWKPYTKKSHEEFGRPFGQQLLWRV